MTSNFRTSNGQAGQAPAVTLEPVTVRCGGGECPTVYKTSRGTLVVQGYVFEPGHAGVSLPSGEQMVEIPVALLAEYLHSSS